MSVINQIKAEIERRKNYWMGQSRLLYKGKDKANYAAGKSSAYNEFLSFLDTLEEKSEIPTNLDDLLDDYFEKLVVPEHQIIFEDTFRKIAKDFYRMGQGSSEKPNTPEGLDEAANAYSNEHNDDCFDAIGSVCPHIIEAFKAGWIARDSQIPKLPDDVNEAATQAHIRLEESGELSFLNIFKAGAEWAMNQFEPATFGNTLGDTELFKKK